MAIRQRDTSLGKGVYYAPDDYVGLGRRVIIFVVDAVVLVMLLFCLLFAWFVIGGGPPVLLTFGVTLTIWFYVVACKRSPLRTAGYWLTGCRLVDLRGQTPSLFALTLRSMLWVFGPFNFLLDLIWCGIDDDRQTLRDRFAGTCLINNRAAPIGAGEIHFVFYDTGTFNLYYPRVTHPRRGA